VAKIGLQLYTVKEDAAADFLGTVRDVGVMGYEGIEFAGFFGTPAAALRSALDDAGLAAAGAVHPLHELDTSLPALIDYSRVIRSPAILFPWIDASLRADAGAWKRIADRFNAIGAACRENGLLFLYHIHGYEFATYDGETGLDLLMRYTDPSAVGLELDTYWVAHGGADVVQTYRQYADRVRYLHFKDALDRVSWHDTEVGAGCLDLRGVAREAARHEVLWYLVEQERFTMPPMESAAISLANLCRLAAATSSDTLMSQLPSLS
jgi:sugar phosphate isomerase/epimerase